MSTQLAEGFYSQVTSLGIWSLFLYQVLGAPSVPFSASLKWGESLCEPQDRLGVFAGECLSFPLQELGWPCDPNVCLMRVEIGPTSDCDD